MNTLQKAWERARNIIRKAQGHDPMCWSSGMAYGLTGRASCPSRLLSLVCKIPYCLFFLCTNTISYETITTMGGGSRLPSKSSCACRQRSSNILDNDMGQLYALTARRLDNGPCIMDGPSYEEM
jgi:hypothetical protein